MALLKYEQVNTKWESTTAQIEALQVLQNLISSWMVSDCTVTQHLAGCKTYLAQRTTPGYIAYRTHANLHRHTTVMHAPRWGGVMTVVKNELFVHFACQDLQGKGLSQFHTTAL